MDTLMDMEYTDFTVLMDSTELMVFMELMVFTDFMVLMVSTELMVSMELTGLLAIMEYTLMDMLILVMDTIKFNI